LDSTFFDLDSTLWLDNTLKIDPGLFAVPESRVYKRGGLS